MEEVTFEFIYLRIFSMFVRVFDICHRGRVWSVVRSRVPVKLWKIPIKLIHTCHTDETPRGSHIDTKLCLKCTKIPWGITHVSHIETRLGFNSLKIQRGDNSCKSYRVETWFTVLSQPLLLQQVQPVCWFTRYIVVPNAIKVKWLLANFSLRISALRCGT